MGVFRPERPPAGESGELGFESAPMPKDDTSEEILAVLQDLDQNQRRDMMKVPKEDGRLLRLLTETIGAKNVIEIGTSNGDSGIWFALALRTTDGKLTTHEIDAGRPDRGSQHERAPGTSAVCQGDYDDPGLGDATCPHGPRRCRNLDEEALTVPGQEHVPTLTETSETE